MVPPDSEDPPAPAEGEADPSETPEPSADAVDADVADSAVEGEQPADAPAPDEAAAGPTEASGGKREVELPPSLYKVVTVFSTLLSVLFVVLGFAVLDRATGVVSNPTGSLVVQAVALVGVPMETLVGSRSAIALVVGLAGLALVGGGAAVYVYGSRFRAPGMGKPKDEADEPSGDG